MRLLADENIPRVSIESVRAAGHDVLAAAESSPGASDRDLLARAATDGRVVVTFDTDFGALVFRHRVAPPAGIVLLRFVPATPAEPGAIVLDLLSSADLTCSGKMTVVDRERVRQRALPRSAEGYSSPTT